MKKENIFCLTVLLTYIFILFVQIENDASLRYMQYLVVVLVAVWSSFNNSMHLWNKYPFIYIYGIIVLCITAVAESYELGEIDGGSLAQPVFIISALMIGYGSVKRFGESIQRRVLIFLYFVLVIGAIAGLVESVVQFNPFYSEYGIWMTQYRVASFYGHPIKFGSSMTLGLFITMYMINVRYIKPLLILLFLYGIYSSLSRSSWIAITITLFLIAFAIYRKNLTVRKINIFIVSVVLMICFCYTEYAKEIYETISARFIGMNETVSSTQRLGAIDFFINYIYNNFNPLSFLFGHGEDAASRIIKKTTIEIQDFGTTDNVYLLFLYNYGFVFLLCVLVYFISLLRKFVVGYDKYNSNQKCIISIIISQFICGFFYEITESKAVAFIFLICIGMNIATQTKSVKRMIREEQIHL